MKRGFDSKRYIIAQTDEIQKRTRKYKKLYLEVGGKLLYDNHASRVLPGYKLNNKKKILSGLKDTGIIYCINAKDIISDRRLSLKKRSYASQAKKDLSDIKRSGLNVIAIAIIMYEGQKGAIAFRDLYERRGYKVVAYKSIPGYKKDTRNAIKGFKEREFIHTDEKIIIVTGPAGGSGKMSVAMSQVYHEISKGNKCGYAKFESFPIWNLPINGPINLAYEAATADLGDYNVIDKLHKKYYNVEAVNYNRDVDNFKILTKVSGKKFPFGYKSVTDMGINMMTKGIIDLDVCNQAATKEILNRQKRYLSEYLHGREKKKTITRMKQIVKKLN